MSYTAVIDRLPAGTRIEHMVDGLRAVLPDGEVREYVLVSETAYPPGRIEVVATKPHPPQFRIGSPEDHQSPVVEAHGTIAP